MRTTPPTGHHRPYLSRNAVTRGLCQARRDRFLLEFKRWRRPFYNLRHALAQAGMPGRVYHRWKKGQVLPQEGALRRYCQHCGLDTQFVLTGIPGKVGGKALTIGFYQEQHQQAATTHERACAFNRLVVETLNVLLEEFPKISAKFITEPEPAAILKHVAVDRFCRFEISLKPLPDGTVGFEVYRVEGGMPTLALDGRCDEGTLLIVRRYLRENTRAYLKRIKDEDVLTPFRALEEKFTIKHDGRYEPNRRRSPRRRAES